MTTFESSSAVAQGYNTEVKIELVELLCRIYDAYYPLILVTQGIAPLFKIEHPLVDTIYLVTRRLNYDSTYADALFHYPLGETSPTWFLDYNLHQRQPTPNVPKFLVIDIYVDAMGFSINGCCYDKTTEYFKRMWRADWTLDDKPHCKIWNGVLGPNDQVAGNIGKSYVRIKDTMYLKDFIIMLRAIVASCEFSQVL